LQGQLAHGLTVLALAKNGMRTRQSALEFLLAGLPNPQSYRPFREPPLGWMAKGPARSYNLC